MNSNLQWKWTSKPFKVDTLRVENDRKLRYTVEKNLEIFGAPNGLWTRTYGLVEQVCTTDVDYKDEYRTVLFCRLGKRHNVSTGRIPKSVGIETVLDCLTFYNHEVFNYFVDKKQIERTIVSDDDTIERLFYR